MYKELEKYKTGEKIDADGILANKQKVIIKLDVYKANLGDLMQDFIKHQTKPWWRRKYYHNHLTKLYLCMLNHIEIVEGF